MDRRAAQAAATRDRILDAATTLYKRRGIRTTSLKAVALESDVARATVLNHFGTTEALAEAVLQRVTDSLKPPTLSIFEGAHSRSDRVRLLVAALFAFYDRSEPWFEMFRGEFESVPALRKGEAQFWQSIEPLYEAALGSRGRDRRVRATVLGLTHPATLGALRATGLSLKQASEVMGDVVAALVDRAVPRQAVR